MTTQWNLDPAIARVLGEEGPWGRHLMTAWRSAAAPDLALELPPDPTSLYLRDPQTHHGALLAWWTPLMHLTLFGLGWTRPDLGLHRWLSDGHPTDDPVLTVIDRWWGPRLADFLAWAATNDTVCGIGRQSAATSGARFVDGGAEPLSDVAAHRRADEEWQRVWGGGSDPLHLGGHCLTPTEVRSSGSTAQATWPAQAPSDPPRATIFVDEYPGWHEALPHYGFGRHEGRDVRIDVVCRPIGWMGTYRRSSLTGGYFRGQHRWHQLGA